MILKATINKLPVLTGSLVLVVSLSGCQTSQIRTANSNANDNASLSAGNTTDNSISEEEYEVYSELIAWERDLNREEFLIFINEKTSYGDVFPGSNLDEVIEGLKKAVPTTVPDEVMEDFRSKNKEPETLSDKFDIKNNYKLGNVSEDDKWGWLSFSRVGFNKEKNIALLYWDWSCGPKCGWGEYVILVKKNGNWRKEPARLPRWLS